MNNKKQQMMNPEGRSLIVVKIEFVEGKAHIHLCNRDDEAMETIMDDWWVDNYPARRKSQDASRDFPVTSYDEQLDADVYEVNAAQLMEFLSDRFKVARKEQGARRPLTPSQREARQKSVTLATQRAAEVRRARKEAAANDE